MYFKKHNILLLSLLVLFSNSGMAFTIHYCGNQIESVSLNPFSTVQNIEESCCHVKEEQTDCCNDRIIKAEKSVDQIIAKTISCHFEAIIYNDNNSVSCFYQVNYYSKNTQKTPLYRVNITALYKLYSQYCFYS